MTDEQIVRQWFLRLLADFRIYSPLYKVTVTREHTKSGYEYVVIGEVNGHTIRVDRVWVQPGEVIAWGHPIMHWKGEQDED